MIVNFTVKMLMLSMLMMSSAQTTDREDMIW